MMSIHIPFLSLILFWLLLLLPLHINSVAVDWWGSSYGDTQVDSCSAADDGCHASVQLRSGSFFYGSSVSLLVTTPNGYLSFGSYSRISVEVIDSSVPLIVPFGKDLDPRGGNLADNVIYVRYSSTLDDLAHFGAMVPYVGDGFDSVYVASWIRVDPYRGSGESTFQVVYLTRQSNSRAFVVLNYGTMSHTGDAEVGFSKGTGSEGIVICDGPSCGGLMATGSNIDVPGRWVFRVDTDPPVAVSGYNCSAVNYCSDHGWCVEEDVCDCDDGYSGDECENIACISFRGQDCSGHGNCTVPYVCSCVIGYEGNRCQDSYSCYGKRGDLQEQIGTCSFPNGTCVTSDTCLCEEGYTGNECDYMICHGLSSEFAAEKMTCSFPAGHCSSPDTCVCDPRYSGQTCSQLNLAGVERSSCTLSEEKMGGFLVLWSNVTIETDVDVTTAMYECSDVASVGCKFVIFSEANGTLVLETMFDILLACDSQVHAVDVSRHRLAPGLYLFGTVLSHDVIFPVTSSLASVMKLDLHHLVVPDRFALSSGTYSSFSARQPYISLHGEVVVTCYGTLSSDSEVCSGHGSCIGQDVCVCDSEFPGPICRHSPLGISILAPILGAICFFCCCALCVMVCSLGMAWWCCLRRKSRRQTVVPPRQLISVVPPALPPPDPLPYAASAPPLSPPPKSSPGPAYAVPEIPEEMLCCVCMDRRKCILFFPCRHMNCCEGCSNRVRTCPICRQQIASRTRVFI